MHIDRFKVKAGTRVTLADHDPGFTGTFRSKDQVQDELENNRERLEDLQNLLYAESKYALLIVLQAMDAGGKDGTIRHVMGAFNPQGVHVTSFKKPTSRELAHDYLWRVHRHTPGRGEVAIFNRSHYEDVLVVRVHNLVPEQVWGKRYDHINAFEKLLADSGATIVKLFLHISKEEQKERFEKRLTNPRKNWKFSRGDLAERALWDDYMTAFEEALSRCSAPHAPWYIIPSDRKWYRNLVVSQILIQVLESLNMSYPAGEPDLDQVVVPD